MSDWRTDDRAPWVANSLRARIDDLRSAERRCRQAFTRSYMGEPANYLADAYREAADLLEAKLPTTQALEKDPAALAKPASEPAGGGVRVKPLVWSDWKGLKDKYLVSTRSDTMIGSYRLGWNDGVVVGHAPGGCNNLGGPWKSMEAAKAAAQSDYERRILSALSTSSPAGAEALQAGVEAVDFLRSLRAANISRDAEYRAKTQGEPLPLLFRTTEFAGEVGELLNVVKKIERERLGWAGKRADRKMLLEEFGGVVATLDLLAMMLDVDLAAATADEFNAVSDRLTLSTKLRVLSSASAQEDGSKDLGAHPRGSGSGPSSRETAAIKLADGYGIVLAMIAAGCSDPQRFAKRMLAEHELEAKRLEITK